MRTLFLSLGLLSLSACGRHTGVSKVSDIVPIGVGHAPVDPIGEIVRLRHRVWLNNGQQEVSVGAGCKIVAKHVDNVNVRAIDPRDTYLIRAIGFEDNANPMWVTFNNASENSGTQANFWLKCIRPSGYSGYYSNNALAIEGIATSFLFTRFPNYNPGDEQTDPTPNPRPIPDPAPDPAPNPPDNECTGVHARCTFVGDHDTAIFTRTGCDINHAMDNASSACLAAGNTSCTNTTCEEI